uniref:Ionotropic glutamate receptor L-glutamate and glycine-binding domain-containing protein n=1 Tax=Anopheles stephensi TaxID=30069 RepID=A0A182YPC0_ANOST
MAETSTGTAMLVNFLVRILTDLSESYSGSATTAFINIDQPLSDHLPFRVMSELAYHPYVNFNLAYPATLHAPRDTGTHIPTIVIKFGGDNVSNFENGILISYIFNYLRVMGRETKLIVLIVADRTFRIAALIPLARTFSASGALDVLFVIVYSNAISIVHFDNASTNYALLSLHEPVTSYFPERFFNLRGRPYVVAWFENEPMSFLRNDAVVGVDVDFINIIAQHQNTHVQYITNAPQDPRTAIDFATYRLVNTIYWTQQSSPLYFPNQFRWCLAVPRSYQRMVNGQIFRPFQTRLWILLLLLTGAFLAYNTLARPALRHHRPELFQIINPPMKMLALLLHFMVLECYIAMLTKQLELLHEPSFPKTVQEFSDSSLPLLVPVPDLFDFLKHNPNHADQLVSWNRSVKYEPERFGILQKCDLFERSIEASTELIGKRLDKRQFFLIPQPVLTTLTVSPFRKNSPLVHTFQRYVNRLNEAGVWAYLVSKWSFRPASPAYGSSLEHPQEPEHLFLELMHMVPIYMIAGKLLLLGFIVFLLEHIVHSITFRRGHFFLKVRNVLKKMRNFINK